MMGIYDYLFYKSFILAKRSKNFDDIPVLGGIMFVSGCVLMNIFTIILFVEGVSGIDTGIGFKGWHKYPFAIGWVLIFLFYYSHKGRYKKIIEHYESKCGTGKQIHPLIVIAFYIVASFGLLLVAALFLHREWIFSSIK